jgi:hypothetical protein
MNGGGIWSKMANGIPINIQVSTLVIDPNTNQTIYAGSDFHGVFRSINGGVTNRHSAPVLPPTRPVPALTPLIVPPLTALLGSAPHPQSLPFLCSTSPSEHSIPSLLTVTAPSGRVLRFSCSRLTGVWHNGQHLARRSCGRRHPGPVLRLPRSVAKKRLVNGATSFLILFQSRTTFPQEE